MLSETYFEGVGTQTVRFDRIPELKATKVCQRGGWVPRECIKWSPAIRDELITFFNKCDYPFRYIDEIPFEIGLASEIRRFFISLDAYIDSPKPAIPYRTLLYGAAEKDFALYLKRVKYKAVITSWNAKQFNIPEWYDEIPEYRIDDIGQIFNYSYLIFWETEDEEDYKWGNADLNQDQDALDEFRDVVKGLLPSRASFDKIDENTILYEISSSMSLDLKTMKHCPHYKIKNKYTSCSKKRHICDRSVLRVSPENTRDTVILCPSDLNTISLIDKQMMEILRVMPGHIHLIDKERVTRKCKRLLRQFRYFLMRDIKKEGITKPRSLLKIMLEELHSKYPDIEVFGYTDFYDKYKLRLKDGSIIYPKRGHGLGMANSLTTLMQLAIHEMVSRRCRGYNIDFESKCLALNDDFTCGFQNLDDLETYWDEEDDVMSELGILRQPEKSFYCYGSFVIAERYFTPWGEYEKTSYQLRELIYPLACYNLLHAKEYFISAQAYSNSKLVQNYLGDIMTYWGYEFFPEEFNYPAVVGGWINERVNSVDLSFLILDELSYNTKICRGFKAASLRENFRYLPRKGDKLSKNKPKYKEVYISPMLKLLGHPSIPKKYWEAFDYLPNFLIDKKYGRILAYSRKSFKRYWDRLAEKRQIIYNKKFDVPYNELLIMIQNQYKTTQFYPSESMIKCYHQGNEYSGNVNDIFIDPNPKLATLSLLGEIEYPFKEDFSLEFTRLDSSTKKVSSLFSKEIQRSLKTEALTVLMTGKGPYIYYPSDSYKPEEQYLNPLKIGEVTSILNWGKGYPELFKEYEHPLVEKKKSVFGRLFSLQELIKLTQLKVNRLVLKYTLNSLREGEDMFEFLEYIAERLYAKKEDSFPDPLEEEESEEELELDTESVKLMRYLASEPTEPKTIILDDQEKELITIASLMRKDGNPFWTWRTNEDGFFFLSDIAKNLATAMATLITNMNSGSSFAEAVNFDSLLREMRDLNLVDKFSLFIISKTSFFEDAREFFETDDGLASDEEGIGLFRTSDDEGD